jgi:hypothetical protein
MITAGSLSSFTWVPEGLLPFTMRRPFSIFASVTVMAAKATFVIASRNSAETIMRRKRRHMRGNIAALPIVCTRDEPA